MNKISPEEYARLQTAAAQNVLTKIKQGKSPTDAEWDLLEQFRASAEPPDPGEPLKDARQERFCQLLFEGKTQTDAYTEAGYRATKNTRSNASRLAAKEHIKTRVAQLMASAATTRVMTKEEACMRLTELTRSTRLAIPAIRELANLLGWYPPKQIDLGSEGGGVLKLQFVEATPEMLEELQDDD